jgi:osmoprotectant transport system substrate-binding protein
MREVYGVTNVNFVQLPQGITYEALDDGTVDTINVFSTDPQLGTGEYVVLEDPLGVFGYQHVSLVVDDAALEELGRTQFIGIVDEVSAILTNDAIIEMNQAVITDRQPEEDVARSFLEAHGLLGAAE